MALSALSAAFREGIRPDGAVASAVKGHELAAQQRHAQLGWVPNPRRRYQTEDFPGLTAQALVVLELLRQQLPDRGPTSGCATPRQVRRNLPERLLGPLQCARA